MCQLVCMWLRKIQTDPSALYLEEKNNYGNQKLFTQSFNELNFPLTSSGVYGECRI